MGLEFAHLLELPAKMQYGPAMYVRVSQGLYPYFAYVGGPLEILAVGSTIALCVLLRRRPGFGSALVAAGCTVAALAVWFAIVQPANVELGSWTPGSVPEDWQRWRAQWEYGHAAGFALLFLAHALLAGVLLRAPRRALR